MLFPYVFSPQTMDKMQEFIEYIFMHVWCAAAPDRPFELSLFRGNAIHHYGRHMAANRHKEAV